jgi:hypothetical protein
MKVISAYLCLLVIISSLGADVFITENFKNMDKWEELIFPKIENRTEFSIMDEEFLKIESNNSASALKMTELFDIFKYPILSWKWKVENIIEKGDARKKSGDDYPIRIYVIFEYDPNKAGFKEKLQYNTYKLIYGEYPPLASLNYIWSNKNLNADYIPSPYTDKAILIPMDNGKLNLGIWKNYSVNILEDYCKVFGSEPPKTASLAIMGDSDNTGEKTLAFIDYIRLEEPR